MCAGIALLASELPEAFLDRPEIVRRIHRRGEHAEVRFLWRDKEPLLPVWSEGRLIISSWGSRSRRGPLPSTGWTWQNTVEAGSWTQWSAESVEIPATYGLENGRWFKICRGVRGILVRDENDSPIAYMICLPSTRYYRVMTGSDRMPSLIGEVI